jgi:hypothetical protein
MSREDVKMLARIFDAAAAGEGIARKARGSRGT